MEISFVEQRRDKKLEHNSWLGGKKSCVQWYWVLVKLVLEINIQFSEACHWPQRCFFFIIAHQERAHQRANEKKENKTLNGFWFHSSVVWVNIFKVAHFMLISAFRSEKCVMRHLAMGNSINDNHNNWRKGIKWLKEVKFSIYFQQPQQAIQKIKMYEAKFHTFRLSYGFGVYVDLEIVS